MDVQIKQLLEIIPEEQIEEVFNQDIIDIGGDFIGFLDIYEALSRIIPKHFTIIDLGCAYNAQCFYFRNHKKVISVDISDCVKFKSNNCEIHQKSIESFIKHDIKDLNLRETFAICNYVPDWHGDNKRFVRETFENVYVFYPHGGEKVIIPKLAKYI
jgi:hypothetical protein